MAARSKTASVGDDDVEALQLQAKPTITAVSRVVGVPQAFRLQKRGNAPDECEDAVDINLRGRRWIRAAVSDGATEAVFSRRWANLLVHHAVFPDAKRTSQNPKRRWDLQWLALPGRAFRDGINISDLPWHVQDKIGSGSFATLMTLIIDLKTHAYYWRSVGDSCLVVVNLDGPTFVPEEFADPSAFGTSPHLIGSNPTFKTSLEQGQRDGQSTLPIGETTFLLMTDALASWFVQATRDGQTPWHDLLELSSVPSAFEAFIEARREDDHIPMRNDDVALVRLTVSRSAGA